MSSRGDVDYLNLNSFDKGVEVDIDEKSVSELRDLSTAPIVKSLLDRLNKSISFYNSLESVDLNKTSELNAAQQVAKNKAVVSVLRELKEVIIEKTRG